jgi:hypothetical protein
MHPPPEMQILTVPLIALVCELFGSVRTIAQFVETYVILVGMAFHAGQGLRFRDVVGENKIPGKAGRFPLAGIFLFSLLKSLGQGLIHAPRLEQDGQILEEKLLGLGVPGGNGGQGLESGDLAFRVADGTDGLNLLSPHAVKETIGWFRGIGAVEGVRFEHIHAGLGILHQVDEIPGHNAADGWDVANVAGNFRQMVIDGRILVLHTGMASFTAQGSIRGLLGPPARIIAVRELVFFRLVAIHAGHPFGDVDIPLRRKIDLPFPPESTGGQIMAAQAGLAGQLAADGAGRLQGSLHMP